MLPETKALYNDDIFHTAAQCFGQTKDSLTDLGGFESFVYEYEEEGRFYILKVTHSIRRTVPYLMGELDFLNYLTLHNIPISLPVKSKKGNWIEVIPSDKDDFYFLAYAFEKLKGRLPTNEDLSSELVQELGQIMGKMHCLAQDYTPSDLSYKRKEWHQGDWLRKCADILPKDQTDVAEKVHIFAAELRQLPQNKDSYGLIHGDIHSGNFFIDENKQVHIFDFDDCEYHWYANDLAITLYYLVRMRKKEEQTIEDRTSFLMKNLLKGYRKERDLPKFWLAQIPQFLKLRDIVLYIILYEAFDIEELKNSEKWSKRLAQSRKNILEDLPIFDIDFEAFEVTL